MKADHLPPDNVSPSRARSSSVDAKRPRPAREAVPQTPEARPGVRPENLVEPRTTIDFDARSIPVYASVESIMGDPIASGKFSAYLGAHGYRDAAAFLDVFPRFMAADGANARSLAADKLQAPLRLMLDAGRTPSLISREQHDEIFDRMDDNLPRAKTVLASVHRAVLWHLNLKVIEGFLRAQGFDPSAMDAPPPAPIESPRDRPASPSLPARAAPAVSTPGLIMDPRIEGSGDAELAERMRDPGFVMDAEAKEQIVGDPVQRARLYRFMGTEHSQQNLEFYAVCERALNEPIPQRAARTLVPYESTYLGRSAPRQVHISAGQYERLIAAFDGVQTSRGSLAIAAAQNFRNELENTRDEVWALFTGDTIERFAVDQRENPDRYRDIH